MESALRMADRSALRMADKSTVNESVRQEEGPILQLNRPLLSIDEYAAREGVSRGIVEECGKLGILQIRRYKGQTFVVDVPLSPYSSTSELAKEFIRPADKSPQVQKTSEPAPKAIPAASKTMPVTAPISDSVAAKAGVISQTVKRMLSKAAEMGGRVIENIDNEIEQLRHTVSTAASKTSEPAASNQVQQTSSPSSRNAAAEAVKISSFEPPRPAVIPAAVAKAVIVEKPAEPAPRQAPPPVVERLSAPAAQPAQITEIPRAVSHPQGNVLQAVISAAQTKLSNFWQIGTIFVSAFLFVAVFVGLWLYMDRKIQLYRLDQAYTSIQKMYTDLVQSKQKTETLETELNTSRTEFERVQTNLNRSQSEIDTARNELAQARRNLETIQGRNAEAVEKLNSQIQELANRLNELTKNP